MIRQFTGKTIIKNNDGGQTGDNLYISDNVPENTRVMFSVTKGSEIWMSYANLGNRNFVPVTMGSRNDTYKSPNCIQYLFADNQGWHFGYNAKPDYRKIYYVKDGKDSVVPCEPVQRAETPTIIKAQDMLFTGWDFESSGLTLVSGYNLTDKTIKVK